MATSSISKATTRVLGQSEEAAFISVAVTLSAVAYLLASAYLRFEREQVTYRLFLLREYWQRLGWPDFFPIDIRLTHQGIQLFAMIALALASALLFRRLQRLQPAGVFLAVYAAAAAVIPMQLLSTIWWPDGRGVLSTPVLIGVSGLLTLGCAALTWRRRSVTVETAPAQPEEVQPAKHDRVLLRLFLLLLVPLGLAIWFCGISAVQGFDSWWYHIPLPARWLTDQRIYRGPEATITDFYPGNFELLVRWILLLGTPRLAFVVSFVAGGLAVWVVYQIGRELGQNHVAAGIAAACAASCTIVANLMTGAYSDTIAALFVLAAILALMRWLRTREPQLLIALGACLGLAAGTKYTTLVPVLLIIAVFLWQLWRSRKQHPINRRQLALSLGAVLGPALLCGGYWYLRNIVQHGNPVFPISMFGLPGVTMEHLVPAKAGLPDSRFFQLLLPWREFGFRQGYYDEGLGPAFAAIALPALLLLPTIWDWEHPRRLITLWLMTLAMYAHWVSTGSLYSRFGLIPVMLTFVFVGEAWQGFPSVLLKVMTVMVYVASVSVLCFQLTATGLHSQLMPPGRVGAPEVVDRLPPAVILNGVSPQHTLPLMGTDYRHRVLTFFHPPTPPEALEAGADYVLLRDAVAKEFTRTLSLEPMASDSSGAHGRMTLWKVNAPRR